MGLLDKLLTGSAASLIKEIGELFTRHKLSAEQKATLEQGIREIAYRQFAETEATVRAEMDAKVRVLVAELQQDDRYTKRARPTLIYAGLVIAALQTLPDFAMFGQEIAFVAPNWFYGVWGAATAVYKIGRTYEKQARIRTDGSAPPIIDL